MANDDKHRKRKEHKRLAAELPGSLTDIRGGYGNSSSQIYRKQLQLPDWNHWRHITKIELWQAIALSVNAEPDDIDGQINATRLDANLLKTFSKRIRLLYDNLEPSGHFSKFIIDYEDPQLSIVRLNEFSYWASSIVKWPDLPSELVAMARKPVLDSGALAEKHTKSRDNKIPGKLPRISVGKLAIEAAWQIEKQEKRAALSNEVIKRLQEWADDGIKPDVLLNSEMAKRGVKWRTHSNKPKVYDVDACSKTLEAWKKSRA